MTVFTMKQAEQFVRQYEGHQWAFEVTSNGTVVVGGCDHRAAIAAARDAGHDGPIVHIYDA